jgi:hypothetical protein
LVNLIRTHFQGNPVSVTSSSVPIQVAFSGDVCASPNQRVKGKIWNSLKIDVAATSTSLIVLCDTSGTDGLIFGFGGNFGQVNVPHAAGAQYSPIGFFDASNLELAFVHCGFDNCFKIQKANKKLYYLW